MKERTQLHLFEFNRFAEAFEAPPEIAQEGIARAVGIRVQHVQQYVKPLISEGLVEERTSHVRGQRRRIKVYFLTERGRSHVATVRGALLKESVPLRAGSGEVHPVPLMAIVQGERRGSTLLELLRELESVGSISEAPKETATKVVDFAQEAPKVERFYGREQEVGQVLGALGLAPVVVVVGMAGAGKTALASKILETFREKRSVFWREVRPWDTAMDLALRLSVFLQAVGRPGLHGTLMGPGAKSLSRVEELLAADLEGLDPLLVFDDVHDASQDAAAFLTIVLRVLKGHKGTSALFLSREIPDFYSRREVLVDRSVVEVTLRGLDPASARSLLGESGVEAPNVDGLVTAAGGNALFLKLLAISGSRGTLESRRTLEAYIAEEIEPSLEKPEHACLEVASMYQVPVTSDGLLLETGAGQKAIIGLERKGLLDPVGADRFVVHDSIRGYFQQGLSIERRQALAAKVGPWLTQQAMVTAERGDLSRGIAYLGNVLAIEVDPERRLLSLEELARLRGRLGDVSGALETYRTALHEAKDVETKARFHGQIAKCLRVQGDLDAADREVEAGLSLLPAQPSPETAFLLFQKAILAYARQDLPRALELMEQAGSWMAGLPKDPGLWGHLVNLRGLIHLDLPNPDYLLVQREFLEAIEAFRTAGYQSGLAGVHNNLGLVESHMGQGEKALADFDWSAEIATRIGDLPTLLTALFSKAGCLFESLGRFEASEWLYRETYKLAERLHAHETLILHHRDMAKLYYMQGRYEEAREAQGYYLSRSGDFLNEENRIAALGFLARICVLCRDPAAAEARLKEAEDLFSRTSSEFSSQSIEWTRGALSAARGESAVAEASFQRAFELPSRSDRGRFLLEYGLFLASVGQSERAKKILSEASLELAWSKPLEREASEALKRAGSRPAESERP